MPNRPRKTPANPGRASIDLGGIFGAFGLGSAGGVESITSNMPASGGAEFDPSQPYADAAPGTRPSMTTLRAAKPSWFENMVTRGEAGTAYRGLDAQLQMQNQQQQFLQQQAAQGNEYAIARLREQAKLRENSAVAEEARKVAEMERIRNQQEGDFQLGQNDTNLALMRAGQSPLPRYSSRGAADAAYGRNRMQDTGFVPAFSGLIPTAQQSQLAQLENAARISYATRNPDVIGESYGAQLRAPISAIDLGERRMSLSESAATEDIRQFNERQKMAEDDFSWRKGLPTSVGGGVFKEGDSWYGINPAREASTQIGTDPATGKPMIISSPSSGPSVQSLMLGGGKRPVGKISPGGAATQPAPQAGVMLSAPLEAAGNPAPAQAQYPLDLSLLTNNNTQVPARTQYDTKMMGNGFIATPKPQPTAADLYQAQRNLQQLLSRPLY